MFWYRKKALVDSNLDTPHWPVLLFGLYVGFPVFMSPSGADICSFDSRSNRKYVVYYEKWSWHIFTPSSQQDKFEVYTMHKSMTTFIVLHYVCSTIKCSFHAAYMEILNCNMCFFFHLTG